MRFLWFAELDLIASLYGVQERKKWFHICSLISTINMFWLKTINQDHNWREGKWIACKVVCFLMELLKQIYQSVPPTGQKSVNPKDLLLPFDN